MASDLVTAFTVAGFPAIADGLVQAGYEPPPPTALEPIRPSGGDDTEMLRDAIGREEEKDWVGLVRMEGRFKTADTLTIQDCHVDAGHAMIETTAATAIVIDTHQGNWFGSYKLDLPFVRNVGPQYRSPPEGSVGVKVVSADYNLITVSAMNWDVPLLLAPATRGVSYNTFHIKRLVGRYACRLQPEHTSSEWGEFGWANQNTFIGGSYGSLSNPEDRVHAIHIVGPPDVLSIPNNNVWVNPSIEGFDVAIDTAGLDDVFIAPRFETGNPVMKFRHQARNNVVIGGYRADRIVFDETEVGHKGSNAFVNGYTA